jgi:hypothetical protein
MKRCPQCLFIYPDADTVCDFDQTPLVGATEAEIDDATDATERTKSTDVGATRGSQSRRSWRGILLAGAVGLFLGMVIVGVSVALHRRTTSQLATTQSISLPSLPPAAPSPTPSVAVTQQTASPEPTVEASTKLPSIKTAHSSTSTGPVSTSTKESGRKNGSSVIVLSTGGKIEADEVWRTRDGIWYRREGIVTLLPKSRVKSIGQK